MPNSVSLFYKKIIVDIPNSLHKEMKIQTTKEGIKLNALAIRIFEGCLVKYQKIKSVFDQMSKMEFALHAVK